jgi:hypothetical protein
MKDYHKSANRKGLRAGPFDHTNLLLYLPAYGKASIILRGNI